MIGSLTGTAEEAGKGVVLLQTSAGVGYEVHTTEGTKQRVIGTDCTLRIHTAVRKESIELFGFVDEEYYSLFLLLITITGIGPKKAIAVLETVSPATLRQAVQEENPDLLVSFGMGKKQAQRITIELQKKITMGGSTAQISGEVVTALLALGYSKKEIGEITKEKLQGESVEEQIKEALKQLRKPTGN